MLRSRVAKQKNQTNSNLLGMDRALLLPRCIQSLVGRAPGPIFFFGVGPPALLMNRGPSLKLDRSQAVGYYKIMKGINYVN